MKENIMITKKQIEKTTAEWAADNPVLSADVIGIEVTTTGYNRFKRGDGVTAWANLAYLDKVPPSTSSGGGDLDISVVDNRIALHNGSETAHNDLRVLISGLDVLVSELGTRLNAIADSDDVDLDQFSEIVALIKSNRSIIEQVTTLKVNYTDIINNLTTNLADKPLSAAQGVVLKGLIDAITVPTKVSAFENDAGYLTSSDVTTLLEQAFADLNGVPIEYAILEYIASSGTQYIDTGFVPNQDTRVVMEVEFAIKGVNEFIMGSRYSASARNYSFNIYSDYYRTQYYDNTYGDFAESVSFDNRFVIDKNKNVTTLDGAYRYTHAYKSFQAPQGLLLFAVTTNGSVSGRATAKMYSCQIYDNGVPVRDFVPVRNKSTFEVGLFDRVGRVFYPNAGTGTFTGA